MGIRQKKRAFAFGSENPGFLPLNRLSQLRRNDQSDQLARKLMKHPAFLTISAGS